jgi:Domain of unknown function (DUF4288)
LAAKSWFSVKLLFASEIAGEAQGDRLCEESIIVVSESDEEHARQTARAIALNMQHDYRNEHGDLVHWRFVKILEIQDLCEDKIESGTEVWSRLFNESQATQPGDKFGSASKEKINLPSMSETPIR